MGVASERHDSTVSGESRSTRRELLATLGGAWAVAAAGCGALNEDEEEEEGNGNDQSDDNAADIEASVTVETREPTTVGSESGTLHGTLLEMEGYSTVDCYFQYREEGAEWAGTEPESLSSPGGFSADLSGLVPDTEYECRAVGEVDGTAVTGGRRPFVTRPDPETAQVEADNLRLFYEEEATGRTAIAQAEVENVGGGPSPPITFETTWYDEERNEVETSSTRLETLQPGETWLVQTTPQDVDDEVIGSVTSTTTVEGEPPAPPEQFSLTESGLRISDVGAEVTGIVENTGTETASVEAIGRVFDGEGHVVADSRASVSDVAAGDTRPFSATIVGHKADRVTEAFDHGVVLNRADR